MPIENENSIPTNEAEADELLSSIEAPESQPIQESTAQPAGQPQASEFAFSVGGKEIKLDLARDRDKLVRYAQQGYDAPTRIGQLTQKLQGWEKKWQESEPKWKSLEEKYGPVDEYVRQNPKFWDHVLDQYQKREQLFNDQSNPLASTVSQLQQQVQELVQYKSQIEQRQQAVQIQQEDSQYVKEFEELKTAYPQVDFATPDESGKSLEYKVLEYATENGIKKFTTAFRDFHHDKLMELREEQAKEKVVKDKQKNTKLGILGITNQPVKRSSNDVAGKSWDQIADDIKSEYKLS